MRTTTINDESNSLNKPYGNTNPDTDKRLYQEEYFGTILKSPFNSLSNTPSNPPNESAVLLEKAMLMNVQFESLIRQFTAIPSYYLISKRQGTINDDYFLFKLNSEIIRVISSDNFQKPQKFLLHRIDNRPEFNNSDGFNQYFLISFLKQQQEILNRMESVTLSALMNFLIGFITNLFKLIY